MIEHRDIVLTGDLKSIDFFYYTQIFAIRHNINGFVQNGNKSHVYIEVEGEPKNLDKFESDLSQLPLRNYIYSKEIQNGVVENFQNFYLRVEKKTRDKKANKKWVKKFAAFFQVHHKNGYLLACKL